ncbi:hypothetical protein TWF694_002254 [Orbilia ellipsospora]|uniref:Histidine kinase n=1 Tax=Orbilia ellipsospora TaxID=2528407 RepID=A0AAV9X2S7_9PEZI
MDTQFNQVTAAAAAVAARKISASSYNSSGNSSTHTAAGSNSRDDNNIPTTTTTTTTSSSSRTRKLSVVSFTSADYNRNDDQWEEAEEREEDGREEQPRAAEKSGSRRKRHQHRHQQGTLTEEDPTDLLLSSSPSSGYSSSTSSSTSSDHHSSLQNIRSSTTKTGNSNSRSARAERDRRRRKLLRNQRRISSTPLQVRQHLSPVSYLDDEDEDDNQQWPPVTSCYGGGISLTSLPNNHHKTDNSNDNNNNNNNNNNLGFPSSVSNQNSSHFSRQRRSSPPSLFRAPSLNRHYQFRQNSESPSANVRTTSTLSQNFRPSPVPLASSSSSSWHTNTAENTPPSGSSSSFSSSRHPINRNVDSVSPNGFHRHSLSHSLTDNLDNHNYHIKAPSSHHHNFRHDYHLHKRRRRHDTDLPEIHFLTPPPAPTSAPKVYSHRHSLSATSTAELLSSASLHGAPLEKEDQHILQPEPTRPTFFKGRSLSTPTGAVEDLFSPLQSLNTSPTRSFFATDSLRDLWNKEPEGCQVYEMVLAPSTKTFTVPVISRGQHPTAAAPPPVSSDILKSLAVPIRDSPPDGLHGVQLLDVLANDPRPTFILGTVSSTTTERSRQSSTTIHNLQLEVVYHNAAFSSILPDAAFSTTTLEQGVDRITFNITDPRYHRWISSSFANASIRNGKCRPYVCPDGILWTQNAFTSPDGARMVLVCGVPLPSTHTKQVHVDKGALCTPHAWEEAMEVARTKNNPDHDEDGSTVVSVSDLNSFPVLDQTSGTPSRGAMGQVADTCQKGNCIVMCSMLNHGKDIESTDSDPLRFDLITASNYFHQVGKEIDSHMTMSPVLDSLPRRKTPAIEEKETNYEVLEEMDVSDDIVMVNRNPEVSTVYSPHLPGDYGFFDWTRLPPSIVSDPHTELVRQVDWAATGFGPIEKWPQSLRTMINLVLTSPHPAAMYWGPEFSVVYNESYIPLIGAKHPSLLGQKYSEGWSEIWQAIEPFFMEAIKTGKPTNKEDDRLFILRNGFREETYFSWEICPIIGEDGTTVGLHNPAFEKTRRVIAERRMLTLREVGERCGSARDVRSFWNHVLTALETNPWDTPFAILYSCKRPDASDSDVSSVYASSLSSTKVFSLEGTIGVPDGHVAAPAIIDLKSDSDGFSVAFREALHIEGNIFLSQESGTLPADLMDGIDVQGFSEDACTAAVVCPIGLNAETPLGFLVLGINPRRPFDEDYRLFIQLLTRQLTTSIASVVLYEEEIRRSQRAARLAVLDRVELSHQLALKSKEAEHSELKFTRLAEFAPVGIFIADFQGKINYYNDMFSEISCHPTNLDPSRWLESVHPADLARTEANWNEVIHGKKRKTWEFRWKTPLMLHNHLGEEVDRWTLFAASPELDADGMLLGVFGSMTNISETKFAEDLQKRRVEEVVELKRQQDNFVDMASHEMRNPLSAILQGADAVLGSLERYREIASSQDLLDDIESSIDVAQTISLCALHQKRVVDDILTMSKLDSALLTVTPVDVQPIAVVERAFKIFEQEAISSETKMTFKVDDSYKNLGLDWVKLDPARLLQVLINLLTNALKFLRTEPSKSIIVTMGAHTKRPSSKDANNSLVYFQSTRKATDLTTGPNWGNGEPVFLTFSVLDTGKGLTEAEKKNLFQKFSQATAKTEVSYGGSGLGLFICKELVHLQSGEIGVQSEAGKGCVFSFYVKARRSARPDVEILQAPVLLAGKRRENGQASPGVEADSFNLTGKSASPQKTVARREEKPKCNYNVLIVEDNLVNQKLLRKALEVAGCTTYVANHGVEALERIKKSVYWKDAKADAQELSLVLMDVEMPVMDGLTCSKRIRELQAEGSLLRHIPIIAVTANARQAQIDKMFEAGMDDVVSKPYRINELMPKLHSVVTRYKDLNATMSAGPSHV